MINVPAGTVVNDGDSGEACDDLASTRHPLVGTRRRRGGRGNARFATSTHRAPRRADLGRPR